jgi:trans-aconitate methyltransferase
MEWYENRDAAHHLEEAHQRNRILTAANTISDMFKAGVIASVSDMGCGDGGLIQHTKSLVPEIDMYGYDACPSNVTYAQNVRGVDVKLVDFSDESKIEYGDLSVYTEVLEHLEDPHGVVRNCPSKWILASSPWEETDQWHYEFHLWAWDGDGFAALIEQGGYTVKAHVIVDSAQIILGERV